MAREFLTDLQIVEISPTLDPANQTLKLYQKSKLSAELQAREQHTDMENSMLKDVLELVEKSAESSEAKESVKAALESIQKFISDSPDEQRLGFQKALGLSDEAEIAKSAARIAEMTEVVQKSVAALDQATPATLVALDSLSALVGHKPIHAQIADLPEPIKAQWDLVQKSNADMASKLAEVEKQRETERKAATRAAYVQKSAIEYKHVPLAGEALADLLEATNANEQVLALLGSVEAAMAKSALFVEQGTIASGTAGTQGKIDNAVAEQVQKSAAAGSKLTKTEAMMLVLKSNPALFADADKAQHDEE